MASVVLAGFSLANPQALSGPATSKTLKTQFAETATAGIKIADAFPVSLNSVSTGAVDNVFTVARIFPKKSENISAEANSASIVIYLVFARKLIVH